MLDYAADAVIHQTFSSTSAEKGGKDGEVHGDGIKPSLTHPPSLSITHEQGVPVAEPENSLKQILTAEIQPPFTHILSFWA